MTKSAMAAAFVLSALLVSERAAAQGTDEVAKLKREIDQLKRENDLLARENAVLKKENEQLKSGGANPVAKDGLVVGAKFTGSNRFSMLVNGVKKDGSTDTEFEITKRSGKEFTAELWGDKRKSGLEVKGTIEDGAVTFTATKTLTEDLEGKTLVDNWKFTGRLEKGVLTGKTSKPKTPRQSYAGEIKLTVAAKE